jgi:DNA-binding response OmpR family regulator
VGSGPHQITEVATAADLMAEIESVRPELVLLDKFMPDKSMVLLINSIKETANPPLIVVLDGRPETERVALDAGADAFLYKGDSPQTLLGTLSVLQSRVGTEG